MSLCTSDVDVHQIEEGLKQWPADNDLHLFDFAFDLYPSMTASMPVNSMNNISALSQSLQRGHQGQYSHLSCPDVVQMGGKR